MGFFTGFASGFAFTSTVIYLTVQVHRYNRLEQRNAIREQTRALTWLASSTGAYDRRLIPSETETPQELPPQRTQPTLSELLKHRWNTEVKSYANKAYETSWEDVRDMAVEGWRSAARLVKSE
ncbi:MICOS complex subunit Mic12 family protein [Aspergillus saccharolyticus JOP 1030-1]|uniref:MICOS complex subunit MIC12 n=1 Tax=Aspergillus saccharolyticus JOP 1030-1 TaxID=1450539 RepID=A0A318ZMZ2_9EURO|nr:hypothetical protein BP01DRAFT_349019 [Aspergillus saccharolyticus JOP 1030-1]PYH41538.1 hypothetical protein BP01DRAFT_349019 [Aspergillus saccharolyticus JOP 1030-1]